MMPIADASQRTSARIAGLAYLVAIPFALFAEFHVLGQLIVSGSAAETARNIIAHQQLFRLGLASNLLVFIVDVILVTALYTTLAPVNRSLAMLALLWRVIETAVLIGTTLNDLNTIRVLGGAEYLRAFDAAQLQALARLSLGAHGAGYNIGLVLAGIGSSVFCYLWLRSGYIPGVLAAFGIFASLLLASCTFSFVVFPTLANRVTVNFYGGPIFLFELTAGLWLLFKPLANSAKVPA